MYLYLYFAFWKVFVFVIEILSNVFDPKPELIYNVYIHHTVQAVYSSQPCTDMGSITLKSNIIITITITLMLHEL